MRLAFISSTSYSLPAGTSFWASRGCRTCIHLLNILFAASFVATAHVAGSFPLHSSPQHLIRCQCRLSKQHRVGHHLAFISSTSYSLPEVKIHQSCQESQWLLHLLPVESHQPPRSKPLSRHRQPALEISPCSQPAGSPRRHRLDLPPCHTLDCRISTSPPPPRPLGSSASSPGCPWK